MPHLGLSGGQQVSDWWHRWMTVDERDGESLALIVGCGIAAVILLIVLVVI